MHKAIYANSHQTSKNDVGTKYCCWYFMSIVLSAKRSILSRAYTNSRETSGNAAVLLLEIWKIGPFELELIFPMVFFWWWNCSFNCDWNVIMISFYDEFCFLQHWFYPVMRYCVRWVVAFIMPKHHIKKYYIINKILSVWFIFVSYAV